MVTHCGTQKIETDRLVLRQFQYSDDEDMLEYWISDPAIQFMYSEPVYSTKNEVKELLDKYINSYQNCDYYRWAVIEKKSNLLIGWSGLKFLREPINGYQEVYELGYRFLPEFWGKGYATEAGKAVLDYGFIELNLDVIYACVAIQNVGSDHILKNKLGFESHGTFVDPLDKATCIWYELTKEKFNKD